MSGGVDVEKLGRLARLNLTADEITAFKPQIAAILGFVEQLSELDTSEIEPMTTALDVANRFRDDVPETSLDPEVATAMAAESQEGQFRVPPVLGTKG